MQQAAPQWHDALVGIRTERLFLLEYEGTQEFTDAILTPAVLGEVASWLNDQELMKFSRHAGTVYTVESQAEYLLKNYGGRKLLEAHPPKYWFIFRSDEERGIAQDRLIGTITRSVETSPHHLFPPRANIGILLGAEQGNGYAAEAMSALINWHSPKGITSFRIGTDHRNEAMIKLATTCGFKHHTRDSGLVYMDLDLRIDSSSWTGR